MKSFYFTLFTFFFLLIYPGNLNAQIISTIAGTGSVGFSGDGGAGTAARLYSPYGVVCDNTGNIILSDNGNNKIRKLNIYGIINTIAGSAAVGFSGDGGAATIATLHYPGGVAADSAGNIYIADVLNDRIRKINTSGIISTFAGSSSAGYSGDGGTATAATLYRPSGVAVDSAGNVYIADQYNHRIRKVSTSGIISTIAGAGSPGFSGDGAAATSANLNYPKGVSVDRFGNVYIADSYNNRIRKINTSGIISTIAGSGTGGFSGDSSAATTARLNLPNSITVDRNGNLYIADEYNQRIRKVNTSGIINTIAGNGYPGMGGDGGAATSASLYYPTGITVDKYNNLYISDISNNRIRKIGPAAIRSTGGITSVCVGATLTLTDSTTGGTWSSSNASIASVNASTGVVSGITAGTVLITYSVAGGGTVTAAITVNAMPAIAAISGPASLCTGATTTFSDSVSGGYWSVSSTSIATVDSFTGVVSPVTSGIDTLKYTTTNSCGISRVTRVITVLSAPSTPAAITGVSTLCTGAIDTLHTTSTGGNWSSSAISVAMVDSMSGVLYGISSGSANISYSVSNSCGSAFAMRNITVGGTLPTVAAISYSTTTVCVGGTATFADATSGGTWSSSSSAVATINSAGVVTGVSNGVVVISYSVTNTCGTTVQTLTIYVISAPSTPATISGSSYVCLGGTTTLTNSSTGGTWHSSTTYASIGTTSGIATGVSVGTTIITYTLTNSCGSSFVTTALSVITSPSAPAAISGASSICRGTSTTFTDATTGGVWTSGSTSVATVGAATGIVTGVSAGTSLISYSVSNSCGTTSVTRSITINTSPATPASILGVSHVCTGTTITLTDSTYGGTWTCSSTGIATIGSTSGVVTGISAGYAVIVYTVSNSCGTSSVYDTINVITTPATPSAISGPSSLCLGTSTTMTDSTTGGIWTSSNVAVATVGITSGVVIGVSAGSANISYSITNSCGVASTTRTLTVNAAPGTPASITGSTFVCVGSSSAFASGTTGGAWSIASTSAATISATGTVYGISTGSVVISYTVSNSCGTAYVTRTIAVNPVPTVMSITGGGVSICPGVTTALHDSTSGGSWSTADASIAVVSSGGVVTGSSAGTTLISYTVTNSCGTISATTSITVNALPYTDSILGTTTLCAGTTITLYDSTTGGIWSSSNISVATVSAAGVVTGVPTTSGTATIFYSVTNACGTVSASIPVTVLPAPYAGSITGVNTVCPGFTTLFHNVVTSGVWRSNDTTIAQVNDTGLVTGITLGTGIISYTVTNSCGSVTIGAYVYVQPFPSASVIGGPHVVCPAKTIQLTNNITDGVWTSLNTYIATVDDTGIVTGGTPGSVYIAYTVSNSCGADTAYTNINVNPYTVCDYGLTVAKTMKRDNITVSPNPSNGIFTIALNDDANAQVQFIVRNMQGVKVYEFDVAPNENKEVNLNVASGIYYLQSVTGNNRFMTKLVVLE